MGLVYWGNEHIPVPPQSSRTAKEVRQAVEEEAKALADRDAGEVVPQDDTGSEETTAD